MRLKVAVGRPVGAPGGAPVHELVAVMARDIQPNIQVIVFSGFDDPVLRADAERIGATYLVKPVPSSYLIQLLQPSGTGAP